MLRDFQTVPPPYVGGYELIFVRPGFRPDGFHGAGQRVLLVGRVQVEIDAAQRARAVALAQDDGDLRIERETVSHAGTAIFVSGDGFLHQRLHRVLKILGRFRQANDVLVVLFDRSGDFFLERLDCHRSQRSANRRLLK